MKNTMSSDKDLLRRAIRIHRTTLGRHWMRNMSARIQDAVCNLDEFSAARTVGCYISTPAEVQTGAILKACWSLGKKVCVPAWDPDTKEYRLALLDRNEKLEAGPHDVFQPVSAVPAVPGEVDIALVPGLAFDAKGNRLGHGCGYYDRLLATRGLRRAFRVGLAFSFQLVDSVPVDSNDERMNMVVTEDGVIVPSRIRTTRRKGDRATAPGSRRKKTITDRAHSRRKRDKA
ncbi:MAG: 5-formyltetrahydrofolate cyclo-ligase [bacterium]